MKKLGYRIVFALIVLVFFPQFAGSKIERTHKVEKTDYRYLSLFSEVSALIKIGYVEEINPSEKFPGAFAAMMRSLDRCSAYLSSGEALMYDLHFNGSVYSAGIFGQRVMNYFYISDVIPDSPAYEAGLGRGDVIKAVNGKSLFSLSYWEMYLSLLSNGPEVKKMIVFRENSDKPELVSLKTGKLRPVLSSVTLNSGVTLVRVPAMNSDSVAFMKKEIAKNPSRLIIDLRNYSAGDYASFLAMCRLFFTTNAKGQLTIKTKDKEEPVTFSSPLARKLSVAAIIGSSTILYNELFAALLRENGMRIVGNPTPGMATMLKKIPLEDGSALLMTEAQFYINGKNICETGVLPHEEIEDMEEQQLIAACNRLLEKQ